MTHAVPPLFASILDDAAVFPPGELPLDQAVPAHHKHRRAAHAQLVGPLVLAAKDLARLAEQFADAPTRSLELALTAPLPDAADAMAAARRLPAVSLTAVEVSLPPTTRPDAVPVALDLALAVQGEPDLKVFVEIPRDARRDAVLAQLTGTGYLAKFRTGGVRADLHPNEKELATSVLAAVNAGVPFKATAGMHHAVRNTDPVTGFEQHGLLNLLTATSAALAGADADELVERLADRDAERVTERARCLSPSVRQGFRSVGTCSIAEPVAELVQLGLLPPEITEDLACAR